MSSLLSKSAAALALCTMLLVSSSDLAAQFSQRGSGIAQQVISRLVSPQSTYQQPTYQQPTYQQPTCPHSTYRPPVYQQPVYVQPTYPQPIVSKPQPAPTPTPTEMARKYTAQAVALFKRGQYAQAGEKLKEVVRLAPKDTNAFQFRALASFAGGKFDAAAADAYDAMALGNTWTRNVLKSIYGQDLTQYDRQLQALQQQVQSKPSMQTHFLLAYHHLLNEQWAAGKAQLEQVVRIQKDEPLSTKLLAAVNAKLTQDKKEVAVQR